MNGSEGTPYDAGAQVSPATPAQSEPVLPDAIFGHLIGTAPWARFMAVLGFIWAGLMVLGALAVLAFGYPGVSYGAPLRLVGLLYIVFAAIYLIPLVPLNQFAGTAGRLKTARTYEVAAEALRYSRSFWRRIGILSIIGLSIGILVLLGAIVVAIMAAMALRS